METPSNISPWLHSLQLYGIGVGDESVSRIRNTREKINSILHKLYELEEKLGLPIGSYKERISAMIAIRDAIGVYGIYPPHHSRREKKPNMLWYKENSLIPEGNEWWDYFGKDDGIRDVGGWVVVSLSDSGIEYLNGIREKVSYWSSSPDKRYYTTVTI